MRTGGEDDVLVVVDLQMDFCPGGALAVPGGDAVVAPINRLMSHFRHVILTQDWHPEGHTSFASSYVTRKPFEQVELSYGLQTLWPDHCIQGTPGAEFHPALHLPQSELILRKGFRPHVDSYSAFFENDHTTATGLDGYLRERGFRRVFLAGLAYDYCVHYSAIDARRAGFETIVLRDACRAIDLPASEARIQADFAQAGVIELNSAQLIAAPTP